MSFFSSRCSLSDSLHIVLQFIVFVDCFSYYSSLLLQLGRTKVFLRAGQIGVLDSRRAEVLDNAAKLVQRRLRTFIARRDFISNKAAAFVLQAYCRGSFASTGILSEFILFLMSFLVFFLQVSSLCPFCLSFCCVPLLSRCNLGSQPSFWSGTTKIMFVCLMQARNCVITSLHLLSSSFAHLHIHLHLLSPSFFLFHMLFGNFGTLNRMVRE